MIISQSRSQLFENSMLSQSNVYSARPWLADNETYSMLDGKLVENRTDIIEETPSHPRQPRA